MMHSPYKYIGTNRAGERVVRGDLILLDGLSHCENAVTLDYLLEISDPRNQARLDKGEAIRLLIGMMADGYVTRDESQACPKPPARLRWKITEKGRSYLITKEASLIAKEANEIFEELARYTHIKVEPLQIEEAPDPDHGSLPSVAVVHLSEEELDDWWVEQDVEVKAAAFLRFHLGERRENIPALPLIPVVGTVSDGGTVTIEDLVHKVTGGAK